MAFSPLSILVLFFPAALFFGGAYLIYRAVTRRGLSQDAGTLLSGSVSSSEHFKSHVSEQPCIYSRVIVEYHVGGHAPWQTVTTIEKRVPFVVGGIPVDPAHAVFLVSSCKIYKGFVKPSEDNLLETFRSMKERSSAGQMTRDVLEHARIELGGVSRHEVLDVRVVSAITRHGGEAVRKHIYKPLRVQECMISQGAPVHVLGAEKPSSREGKSVLTGDMAITDSGEEAVRHYFKEKAYLGAGVGAALLLFSFLLFFVLLSSI